MLAFQFGKEDDVCANSGPRGGIVSRRPERDFEYRFLGVDPGGRVPMRLNATGFTPEGFAKIPRHQESS